uniref:Nucleolar GTP-binding protein 1 n=1 Tax=Colletotrichum fructicola (strain Nara gc5) TaxID=1213859 RepID=L2FG29_COLFN
MKTQWKDLPPVPNSQEFLDIVLSRTQRRLPTQIRSGFKISRIRGFYTRKVKFTQETVSEKLGQIIESFPRLNDIHPFHKDLINTLYDADHFKIALGQLSTAKHLIETISRDYVRLLKYGQSLFQCKQLKRAALGRMATLIKRLKDPLVYLDQVRQHLGRLPSIDPNTRTLLITGFPNVGKSSFLRSVSRADVDVQPYAFTTKSLFCGHFDYKYLRFQCIDTPGILDHPLEEMNTVEMQSVTAIAHLRSAILYFMDLSEQCGYSIQAQINLFQSIKPLFQNKIVFIVVNKIDVVKPEDLDAETQEKLQGLLKSGEVEMLQLSCNTQEGVQQVKNTVCERLIAERVSQKLNAGTNSSGALGRRRHGPYPRRPAHERPDPVDMRADWLLKNPEWKYDKIPEVFNGQNVYDFVDPDIDAKLQALEEEEERLDKEGYYESDEDLDDEEEADILNKAELIREKQALIRNEAKMKKRLKNQAIIPRKSMKVPLSQMDDALDQLGVDTTDIVNRARAQSRPRGRSMGRSRAGTEDADAMDVDATPRERLRSRSQSRARSQAATDRRNDGVTDDGARTKAERLAKLSQKKMNRNARQGEADRHTTVSLQRHLVAGKRGMGKTQRR